MIQLHALPAYSDNYIWCLFDQDSAYVVDPGDAEPVFEFLKQNQLRLAGILITHHHWDHVTGISPLLEEYPQTPVWGPARETIPGLTESLKEGDVVNIDWDIQFSVLEVPGHTLGHIAYYAARTPMGPLLFCGDTLFSSGCGRLFEGTPEQMHHSLSRIKELPPKTLVCCTHEYTMANLRFAAAVEPENKAISSRITDVKAYRDQSLPSLPSNIALELDVNPFLRVAEPSVIAQINKKFGKNPVSDAESFAILRRWKDSF